LSGNKYMVYLLASLLTVTVSCKSARHTTAPPRDTTTVVVPKEVVKKAPEPVNKKRIYDKQLNVALIMPFYLGREFEDATGQIVQISNIALDYYQGMLIAADSLKNMGINLNIFVYDNKKDTMELKKTLLRPEMKTMNLIIGPIFREQIQMVSNFSKANKIPMVFPFSSSNSSSRGNPYIIQANPDHRSWGEYLAYYLKDNFKDAQVLIIRDGKNVDKEFSPYFEKMIDSISNFSIKSTPFLKGPEWDYDSIHLDPDKPNLVIVSSVEETVVNSALALLKDSDKELHVFGLQNWLDFKTNYYNLWEVLHVNILTNYYIDYNAKNVRAFRKLYRQEYYTEPSEYAFRGFDQLLFLGKNMLEHGPLFTEAIVKKKEPALHTQYHFMLNKSGEIENKYIHLLQFRDFELQERVH
jgi:hypothetical protein